jgi:hypothetical protein
MPDTIINKRIAGARSFRTPLSANLAFFHQLFIGSDELTIFQICGKMARMIVTQSSTTALRPCPSRTFENSPAIYGWVYRPLKIQSPVATVLGGKLKMIIFKEMVLRDVSPNALCRIRSCRPKIRKPLPSCASLCKTMGRGEGQPDSMRGRGLGYLNLFKVT